MPHLMRLVYLSPVPWGSFAQRPHKFIEWFHGSTGGDVLWLNPYPTRFPSLSDLNRTGGQESLQEVPVPDWLTCRQPCALPIEPLPGSGRLNAPMWRALLDEVTTFADREPTLLVIGKPSVLAIAVLKKLRACPSVYDAMDDFPAFYGGLSRLAMRCRELQLVRTVGEIWGSSSALISRWHPVRKDVRQVHNALDASALHAAMPCTVRAARPSGSGRVFGYVGTIGAWFDWNWVISLARSRPADRIRLIGPAFTTPRIALPHNIEMLPPCNHRQALRAMQDFDVGLIPFTRNRLTASVDPIKFYEYRALGLPVLSTDFGEMSLRRDAPGTFLSGAAGQLSDLVRRALVYVPDAEQTRRFVADNTWEARFASTGIL